MDKYLGYEQIGKMKDNNDVLIFICLAHIF